jgi:dihydropteroate synthase
MTPRKKIIWKTLNKDLSLGEQTLIMGILNTTPDSFSDGGQFTNCEIALQHALQMIKDGAHIIDIGGESTRPGAEQVSLEDELQRTIPVIQALRQVSDIAISIDTTKATVAKAALEAGANIINDVSGLQMDPQMIEVARDSGAGCVVMHMRGTPQDMQTKCNYRDVAKDVFEEISSTLSELEKAGIQPNRLVLDPGIGFSKTAEQNIELMQQLNIFAQAPYPMLLGTSRKSFIGHILNEPRADQRLWGTAASLCVGIQAGSHILRVHDVKEMAQVARVFDSIH